MATGVTVKQECVDRFNELKIRHNCRYILFQLTDDLREIKIAKVSEKSGQKAEEDWKTFVEDCSATKENKECRYAVFDVEFIGKTGVQVEKLLFVMWAPEDAKLKLKMVYASSKDVIKKKLDGINREMQANELADLTWERVLEICN